jgi:WD40 repeat protein
VVSTRATIVLNACVFDRNITGSKREIGYMTMQKRMRPAWLLLAILATGNATAAEIEVPPVHRSARSADIARHPKLTVHVRMAKDARRSIIPGYPPKLVLKGARDRPEALTFSPDGCRLAVGRADGTVEIWDLHSRRIADRFNRLDKVLTIGFSKNGDWLAASGQNGALVLWNIKRAEVASTLQAAAPVFSLAYSPDDSMLITAGLDGTIQVWDTASTLVSTLDRKAESTISVFELSGVPYVATIRGGKLQKWNLKTMQRVEGGDSSVPDRHRWARDMKLSPDGRWLAVPIWLQELPLSGIALVETESRQQEMERDSPTPYAAPSSNNLIKPESDDWLMRGVLLGPEVAFSFDATKVAARFMNEISILAVDRFEELRRLRVDDRDFFPVSIVFSSDGKSVASGFTDGSIRIWRWQ